MKFQCITCGKHSWTAKDQASSMDDLVCFVCKMKERESMQATLRHRQNREKKLAFEKYKEERRY